MTNGRMSASTSTPGARRERLGERALEVAHALQALGPQGGVRLASGATLQSMRSRCSSRSPTTSRIAARTAVSGPSVAGPGRERLAEEREPVRVVGEEGVLLGVEVAEERAGRDVGRGRDLLHRHVLEAPLGREAERGVGDLLAGAQLVALRAVRAVVVGPVPARPIPAWAQGAMKSPCRWRNVSRGTLCRLGRLCHFL